MKDFEDADIFNDSNSLDDDNNLLDISSSIKYESTPAYIDESTNYNHEPGIFDESANQITQMQLANVQPDEQINEQYLPAKSQSYAADCAYRDGIPLEASGLSLTQLVGIVTGDRIGLYPKQNDLSQVIHASFDCLVVTEPRNHQKISAGRIHRTILDNRIRSSVNTLIGQPATFDFGDLVITKNREFSSGKIKFLKPEESGPIEAISRRDGTNANATSLFAAVTSNNINFLRGKNNDTALINQFLVLYPPPVSREWVDAPIDYQAIRDVGKIFAFVNEAVKNLQSRQLMLHFDVNAQAQYDGFVQSLDNYLNTTNDEAGLCAYIDGFREHLPRLALLLYIMDCAECGAEINESSAVDLPSMRRAINWIALLEAQARETFNLISQDDSTEKLIMEKIKAGKLDQEFTLQQICRPMWSGLKSRTEVLRALGELVRRGYLTEQDLPAGSQGGRSTTTYQIVIVNVDG